MSLRVIELISEQFDAVGIKVHPDSHRDHGYIHGKNALLRTLGLECEWERSGGPYNFFSPDLLYRQSAFPGKKQVHTIS